MYQISCVSETAEGDPKFHRQKVIYDPSIAVVTGKHHQGQSNAPHKATEHVIRHIIGFTQLVSIQTIDSREEATSCYNQHTTVDQRVHKPVDIDANLFEQNLPQN